MIYIYVIQRLITPGNLVVKSTIVMHVFLYTGLITSASSDQISSLISEIEDIYKDILMVVLLSTKFTKQYH